MEARQLRAPALRAVQVPWPSAPAVDGTTWSTTGLITGPAATAGTATITVTARNTSGSASATFGWTTT